MFHHHPPIEEIESWSEEQQQQEQLRFIGSQLLALDGRRYTPEMMKDSINLYLRGRSSYKELRKHLVLPNPKTLLKYFGKLGIAGAEEECKKTIQRVFSTMSEEKRSCFISFDEIHIRPGFQYQGKYMFGEAQNTQDPSCPATKVLAVMVNPSFGGPAFVARLVPVHFENEEWLAL